MNVNHNSQQILEAIEPHINADEPGDIRSVLDEKAFSPNIETIDTITRELNARLPHLEFTHTAEDGWSYIENQPS
ncbi:hypothetical protein [uncultured Photobacterium sp.]|uniref:hypothetical protein n=1 Tax=uncultured Photobacterium sp. TaxID=173973 RepID=UPI0026305283|nr:hypothetical protein [uncultured Photobacterium sp.]